MISESRILKINVVKRLFAFFLASVLFSPGLSLSASWKAGSCAYQGMVTFWIENENGASLGVECDGDGTNSGLGQLKIVVDSNGVLPPTPLKIQINKSIGTNYEVVARFGSRKISVSGSYLEIFIEIDKKTGIKLNNMVEFFSSAKQFIITIETMDLSEDFNVDSGRNIPKKSGCKFGI